MKLIGKHIGQIKLLCKKYHVAEMFVLGSVTRGNFSNDSDVDFLVKFDDVDPDEYFDNYMS